MSATNLRWLMPLAGLFLLAGVGATAPPSDVGPPGSRETGPRRPPAKPRDFQSIGADRQLTTFSGTVLDLEDRPLSDVIVKLFIDGALMASGLSDANGYYELRSTYDPAADVTALLWYVAPDPVLLPKQLVIRESRASQGQGLISKCVGRAVLIPGRQFRVYLFDAASRVKDLSEQDCLP